MTASRECMNEVRSEEGGRRGRMRPPSIGARWSTLVSPPGRKGCRKRAKPEVAKPRDWPVRGKNT